MENNNEQKGNNGKRYKQQVNKICKDLDDKAAKEAQEILNLGDDHIMEEQIVQKTSIFK